MQNELWLPFKNTLIWPLMIFLISWFFIIINSKHHKKEFIYSPFHKTLPRSCLQMHWVSARFYEMGDSTTTNNSFFVHQRIFCVPPYDWLQDPASYRCLDTRAESDIKECHIIFRKNKYFNLIIGGYIRIFSVCMFCYALFSARP